MFENSNIPHLFYPSSIYTDELPLNMGEYAIAKSTGELYCDFLSKNEQMIQIYKPKLPRTNTDQTVSNFPIKNANPSELMIQHLRTFNNLSQK